MAMRGFVAFFLLPEASAMRANVDMKELDTATDSVHQGAHALGGRAPMSDVLLTSRGVAVAGYDVVSYWAGEGAIPLKGISALSSTIKVGSFFFFGGVKSTFWFSSLHNKNLFDKNPKKYLPAFGGFCAKAVSEGEFFYVDPRVYKIQDGRLLLFFANKDNTYPEIEHFSTLDIWESDPQKRMQDANKKWKQVKRMLLKDPMDNIQPDVYNIHKPIPADRVDDFDILLTPGSVAVAGYDVVSYWAGEEAVPLKGIPTISSTIKVGGLDIIYWFASAENKAMFDKEPERYLPAYGGYCAKAVSEGNVWFVDPTYYKIQDGKLLLFFANKDNTYPEIEHFSTLDIWESDATKRMQDAISNWKEIEKKKVQPDVYVVRQ